MTDLVEYNLCVIAESTHFSEALDRLRAKLRRGIFTIDRPDNAFRRKSRALDRVFTNLALRRNKRELKYKVNIINFQRKSKIITHFRDTHLVRSKRPSLV